MVNSVRYYLHSIGICLYKRAGVYFTQSIKVHFDLSFKFQSKNYGHFAWKEKKSDLSTRLWVSAFHLEPIRTGDPRECPFGAGTVTLLQYGVPPPPPQRTHTHTHTVTHIHTPAGREERTAPLPHSFGLQRGGKAAQQKWNNSKIKFKKN